MNDIFLCCSFKNKEILQHICEYLRNKGFNVYSPIEHNDLNLSMYEIMIKNTEAIKNSKIVVAIVEYFGIDFGFEIGFSYGIQKPIIPFTVTGKFAKNTQIIGCLNITYGEENNYNLLLQYIKRSIKE